MTLDDGVLEFLKLRRLTSASAVQDIRVEPMSASSLRASALIALTLAALSLCSEADARGARPAKAGGTSVTVDYGVNLAGFPIGTAQLSTAFEGSRYSMNVSAQLTGLAGAVTGGQGSARASGAVGGQPMPNAFAIATRTSTSGIAVRMAMSNGNVSRADIIPPLPDMGDRVPVSAAAKRGIVDPASALVMPVSGQGNPLDPGNCNRTLPVFDGATRFNVLLSYAETRQVEKPGYSGPVLVCNARYQAIGGHRPDRPGVRFMEENRDMSVWLAPVEGVRVLLPIRISVRTTVGTNIIEATRWSRSGPAPTGTAAGPQTGAESGMAQASLAAH